MRRTRASSSGVLQVERGPDVQAAYVDVARTSRTAILRRRGWRGSPARTPAGALEGRRCPRRTALACAGRANSPRRPTPFTAQVPQARSPARLPRDGMTVRRARRPAAPRDLGEQALDLGLHEIFVVAAVLDQMNRTCRFIAAVRDEIPHLVVDDVAPREGQHRLVDRFDSTPGPSS